MKFVSLAVTVLMAMTTQAMDQSGADLNSTAYVANVGDLSSTEEVSDFTDKYAGYISSQVYFNERVIILKVLKESSITCSDIAACSKVVSMYVPFKVLRAESNGCYDSYYGKADVTLATRPVERIIIQRFATERCQTIAKPPEGFIRYRISGLNSKTGIWGSAEVRAKLVNVNLVPVSVPVTSGFAGHQ